MSEPRKIKWLRMIYRMGFFRAAKWLTKNQIRILAYHRFANGHGSPGYFERQVCYLKKSFNIIDLQSCLEFLTGRRGKLTNSVLITVDDGYQDFYNVAFPILRKYHVPATVFLTVDFIDKRIWLWHDFLNFAIKNTRMINFGLNGRVFDLTDEREKAELKRDLDGICTSVPTAERDAFTHQVHKKYVLEIDK